MSDLPTRRPYLPSSPSHLPRQMKRHLVVCGVVAALAGAGCGSDEPTTPVNVVCTIVFSGALTTTHTCSTQMTATYTTANDSTVVNGGVQGTPALASLLRFKGTPVTGTFTHNAAGARGFVSASSGSNGWIAATAGMLGAPVQGTWTLTLTNVTSSSTTAQGTTYTLHGTLDAFMPSASGGGTSLTAKVTF